MHLCTLDQLAQVCHGTLSGQTPRTTPIGRIVCDSRAIKAGDVFAALPGTHHNGATFVPDALERGALGCLVERSSSEKQSDDCDPYVQNNLRLLNDHTPASFIIYVNNTHQAIRDLAVWHRNQFSGVVIGVTGSVGKTTTRELIHTVLNRKLRGTRSPKNYNNELGLPLSVLQSTPNDQYLVLELGARQPGEIRELAKICCPHIGVITRIAETHLENFNSLEAIAHTKAELAHELPKDGLLIINGDDHQLSAVCQNLPQRIIRVGMNTDNDWCASDIRVLPERLEFTAHGKFQERFTVPVNGDHHIIGILCAIAVATEMKLSVEDISAALTVFNPPQNRCQTIELGPITVIDDSYNSSPASMTAALRLLSRWPTEGRKILITGSMLELGTESAQLHRQIGNQCAETFDLVITCGKEAMNLADGALLGGLHSQSVRTFNDVSPLCQHLPNTLLKGDVVLVKGSRASAMNRVVESLVTAYNNESQPCCSALHVSHS